MRVKFADICTITSSKRIFESEYVDNGIPFIRGQEISDGSILDENASFECYISQERYNELKSKYYVPSFGDILITAVGTIGNLCYIDKPRDFYFKDGNVILFTAFSENVYSKYLFYYMKSPMFKKQLEYAMIGAVQKALTMVMLNKIVIDLPDIETQKTIVAVLDKIDSKISNNNRINAELESMAKTIYDYWFTQFDFPDENGKPYKSSGGKMVWNEELKREIPEGWGVKPLGDIIDISNRRINSKEIGDRVYVPIEVIPRKKMSFYETADIEKAATGLCPFEKNSILLSNRRVYFHKVSISPFDGVTRDTVIIINPKKKNNLGYVYQLVNSAHFIEYATRNSYGTEQPVLATPTVQNYLVLIPNNDLATLYSEKIQPLIDKVLSSQLEKQQLASLRDWLLPMLMNGQVGLES